MQRSATERWARELERWAIPEDIARAVADDPWTLPPPAFAAYAEADPVDTPTRARCLEALAGGGSVLDVGAGAGAASIPLAPPASRLLAVDEDPRMLALYGSIAGDRSIPTELVEGRWPDVAERTPAADVVVCANVLFNVPDIGPFLAALHDHATARVVIEVTASHPRAWMNPYWSALHGLDRPAEPTAQDARDAIIETLGIEPREERWESPFAAPSDDQARAQLRRALCLPLERDADLQAALRDLPPPATRRIVTYSWDR